MGRGHDAGGPMDVKPDVASGGQLRASGMQTDAEPNLDVARDCATTENDEGLPGLPAPA